MHEGKILYAQQPPRCFIKMEGAIRHPLSPGFDAFIQNVFAQGNTHAFTIDMRDTAYIDSTNLGLLAKIARNTLRNGGEGPVIVSINEDVNTILRSMGFDRVFTIIDTACLDAEYTETAATDPTHRERAKLILEAHKTLMEMNETCRDQFRDVVEMFEKAIPPD